MSKNRYFAEIDKNNNILRVIVAESLEFCQEFLGGYLWVESIDGVTGPHGASRGGTYDTDRNYFYPRKEFDSWIWDWDVENWVSPTPRPSDEYTYWNEETLEWVLPEV